MAINAGNDTTGDVKYIVVVNDDISVKPTGMRSVYDDSILTCTPTAQLSYTNVIIKSDYGSDMSVCALVDLGAQLPVINANLIQNHNPEVMGNSKLQPFCGNAIDADWVRLKIQAKTEPKATNYIPLIVLWYQS